MIGTVFLLAVLFASGIETLATHHHCLSGDQRCTACRVVNTSADAPPNHALAPAALPEDPTRPNEPIHLGPGSSHPAVLRLRAPPEA